jgi:WD40 repeat protein
VTAVAVTRDGGLLASGSGDGVIKLWDLATRRESVLQPRSGWGFVTLAFAPDGRTLASNRGTGSLVVLWDVATGSARRTLAGHAATVLTLAFAPDGATLASGSADASVRFWDMSK